MHETNNNTSYKVIRASEGGANLGRVISTPLSNKILKPTPNFKAPIASVKTPANKFKTNC